MKRYALFTSSLVFFNLYVFSHCVVNFKKVIVCFNVLCILDMDKLEMFDSLENELHIIGDVGSCLETLEILCQRKCCRFKMLLMRSVELKKRHSRCRS
jgi:hypothetical protein